MPLPVCFHLPIMWLKLYNGLKLYKKSLHLECFLRLSSPLLPFSIFLFFICYNFIKAFLVFWWWRTAGKYIPFYLLWAVAFSHCLTSRRSDQISSCSLWWPLLPSFSVLLLTYTGGDSLSSLPPTCLSLATRLPIVLTFCFFFRTEWKRELFMCILHYAAKLSCSFIHFGGMSEVCSCPLCL